MTELRLYYDNEGRVICYATENLPGQYIVIDAKIFAQARPDVRVIDGKVVLPNSIITQKIVANVHGDLICAGDDVSIIMNENFPVPIKRWSVKTCEHNNDRNF